MVMMMPGRLPVGLGCETRCASRSVLFEPRNMRLLLGLARIKMRRGYVLAV